jgi:predicted nucleic acid-binding protein
MGEVDAGHEQIDILLNCTVLSNFALVGRLDLLQTAVGGRAATTEAVIQEFNAGIALGYFPQVSLEWLPVLPLSPEEQATYQQIHPRLGAGEASCLAVAHHRGLKVATDDGDSRRYAQRTGIAISGTLGILVQLVRSNILTLQEGNAILAAMIQQGYRAPEADLSALRV